MKNMKKLIAIVTMVGVLGTAGVAFAAGQTPGDIAADLTSKTVEELYEERAEGKTFGAIAKDAGKLEEFKQQMLEQKKAVLDQSVEDGELTQEEADELYSEIKNNQANCDGSGNAAIGRKYGACFGQGNGMGNGQGAGRGARMRNRGKTAKPHISNH
jgi:hypothetical protein